MVITEGSDEPLVPFESSKSPTTMQSLRALILGSKLNVLLVFCIFGPLAGILEWGDSYSFTVFPPIRPIVLSELTRSRPAYLEVVVRALVRLREGNIFGLSILSDGHNRLPLIL